MNQILNQILAHNDNALVNVFAGGGKLQPLTSRIYTPEGYKLMGNVNVGDFVISDDGLPTKVIKVVRENNLKIYKILFDDDSFTECCEDHLWAICKKRNVKKSLDVLTTNQILEKVKVNGYKNNAGVVDIIKNNYRFKIPACKPVAHTKKNLILDPYLLGIILGNGYIPENATPCFSCHSQDISFFISQLTSLLPRDVTFKQSQHYVSMGNGDRLVFNRKLGFYLNQLGLLGLKSRDKFIPEDYLYSSIEDRKLLLAGLLDTDGTCTDLSKKKKISYSTFSEKLSMQVCQLVRSLGGYSKINSCTRIDKGTEYHISIRLSFNPFILPRKNLLSSKFNYTYSNNRAITKIEFIGYKDGQCITVENPSQLYLTDDYIVTHNSTLCANIIKNQPDKRFLYLTFNKVMAEEFKSKLREINSNNCEVKTVHSLAFHKLIRKGWNPGKLNRYEDFPMIYGKFIKEYPNVDFKTIKTHYEKFTLDSELSITYAHNIKNESERRCFLDIIKKTNNQELPPSHNFYLKKYALTREILDYDCILYDECQDLNPLSYLILQNQTARVIGVGDNYQNIYETLMNTVNLFELNSTWKTYYGVNSYRVTQDTADIANLVLGHLGSKYKMVGLGSPQNLSDICLFSSNFDLLKRVYNGAANVNVIMNKMKIDSTISFVEDILHYTKGDEKKIKDGYLKMACSKGFDLKKVAAHYSVAEENDKAQMVAVLKNNPLHNFRTTVMSKMNEHHIKTDKTYSTVYQSKGLTFRNVYFESPHNMEQIWANPLRFRMELNLIYVAITRASGNFYTDQRFWEVVNQKKK